VVPPASSGIPAWRAVLQAHSALMRLYEREMRQDCGISLAWYDVLIHLSEAPNGSLRMSDLAAELLLSPSWLTRRIDGMQEAGLVERCRAADDGRAVCVELTRAGRKMFRRAAVSHGKSIHAHFLAYLDPSETDSIQAWFGRVESEARRSLNQTD
jgi:DNA-binding MarR family transcriptional regulator